MSSTTPLNQITLTAGGNPTQSGSINGLDCNDQNVGVGRTPTPTALSDNLTIANKEYVLNNSGGILSGFINDHYRQGESLDYRNQFNNTTLYGLLNACNNLIAGTPIAFTGLSAYQTTKTLIEAPAVSINGVINAGDIIFIVGSPTTAIWLSGKLLTVDEVILTGTTGLVVDLTFIPTPSITGDFIKSSLSSFNLDSESNTTVALSVIGPNDIDNNYLGVVETYSSVAAAPSPSQADFISPVPLSQPASGFLRFTDNASIYDGINPFLSYPGANTVRVNVPFNGDSSGTFEYVLFTPTINIDSTNPHVGILNFSIYLDALTNVTSNISVEMTVFKSTAQNPTYSLLREGTVRTVVTPNTYEVLGNTILDQFSTNDNFMIAIRINDPTLPGLQLKNYNLLVKG